VKEPKKFHNYETEKITRKDSDVAEYIELLGSSTWDRHARRISCYSLNVHVSCIISEKEWKTNQCHNFNSKQHDFWLLTVLCVMRLLQVRPGLQKAPKENCWGLSSMIFYRVVPFLLLNQQC